MFLKPVRTGDGTERRQASRDDGPAGTGNARRTAGRPHAAAGPATDDATTTPPRSPTPRPPHAHHRPRPHTPTATPPHPKPRTTTNSPRRRGERSGAAHATRGAAATPDGRGGRGGRTGAARRRHHAAPAGRATTRQRGADTRRGGNARPAADDPGRTDHTETHQTNPRPPPDEPTNQKQSKHTLIAQPLAAPGGREYRSARSARFPSGREGRVTGGQLDYNRVGIRRSPISPLSVTCASLPL